MSNHEVCDQMARMLREDMDDEIVHMSHQLQIPTESLRTAMRPWRVRAWKQYQEMRRRMLPLEDLAQRRARGEDTTS